MQMMVKRLEGAAAQREGALSRRVAELERAVAAAQREASTLRTAAGSEESKARALEQQLEAAHRKALTEVESERTRLQVRDFPLPIASKVLEVAEASHAPGVVDPQLPALLTVS
jgi:predicted  nucleic acid-binding Zn-ribbon protein